MEEHAASLLRAAQRFLHLLLFGDVDRDPDYPFDLAVLPAQRLEMRSVAESVPLCLVRGGLTLECQQMLPDRGGCRVVPIRVKSVASGGAVGYRLRKVPTREVMRRLRSTVQTAPGICANRRRILASFRRAVSSECFRSVMSCTKIVNPSGEG